jgi:hypothetical protein
MKGLLMNNSLKVISCFTLLACSSANAELISKDWLAKGDGLLTYDTETKLYWLDVNYTNSGNDVDVAAENNFDAIQSRLLDPGDPLHAFRHATVLEVNELFQNAGLNVPQERDIDWLSGLEATPIQTHQFITLLGATSISNGREMRLDGYTSTYCYELPEEEYCGMISATHVVISGVGIDKYNRTYCNLVNAKRPTSHYRFYTGHFLVVKENPSQLEPEPICDDPISE